MRVDAIRTRAISMLATVWRDAHVGCSYLKALVQSDEDSGVRSAAVEELARGWKNDPDVQKLL